MMALGALKVANIASTSREIKEIGVPTRSRTV